MGQAVTAQILAAVAQIVGLRRAAIVDAFLHATPDMAAID
jgi:hypothetical protein